MNGKASTLVCSGKESQNAICSWMVLCFGNIRRMQSTGLKEHLDYYRPENTTSVFGPNTNAYFPKMYMSKDMNQRYKPVTYKMVPMPRLKISTRVYFPRHKLSTNYICKIVYMSKAENVLTITSLPSGLIQKQLIQVILMGTRKNLSATNNYIFWIKCNILNNKTYEKRFYYIHS